MKRLREISDSLEALKLAIGELRDLSSTYHGQPHAYCRYEMAVRNSTAQLQWQTKHIIKQLEPLLEEQE